MRTPLRFVLTVFAIVTLSPRVEAAPAHVWSQRFGSTQDQVSHSVAVDGAGNVVITGELNGTTNFGGGNLTSAGGTDLFIARYDINGNHLWSKRFGDASAQIGNAVAVDGSGNVLITGELRGTVNFGGGNLTSGGGADIFVLKLDANGNHVWSARFGDASRQIGESIAVDGSGNVVVTGELRGTANFGGGNLTSTSGSADIFVAEFNSGGTHLWSKRFGDGSTQIGHSVSVDGAGNVLVTGELAGVADFGGGNLTSAGSSDVFLAKFTSAGAHVWSKRFGDASAQIGRAAATYGPGNTLTITGELNGTANFGGGNLTSAGGTDIFVATFDAGGNHVWSKRFGGANTQIGSAVVGVSSGDIVVTGRFQSTVDFGGGPLTSAGNVDVFLAKFDASGNHVWSQRYGSTSSQYGYAVAADGAGQIALTGRLSGSANFGGGTLTSAGGIDVYLVSFFDQTFVPVLISRFAATTRDGAIEIRWGVSHDEALAGFTLYRREDTAPFPVIIASGPFDGSASSYVDTNVRPATTYHYELVIRARDGSEFRSTIATASTPALVPMLAQNYPNPFNPQTTISFSNVESGRVILAVYNTAGERVRTLVDQSFAAGTHTTAWNGRSDAGATVAAGVYFYRLTTGGYVSTRKMVLLK